MQSSNQSFTRYRAGLVGSVVVATFVAFATVAAPASAQSGFSFSWGKSTIGSGKMVDVQRSVAEFDRVVATDGFRIMLRRGAEQKLTIKADDNIEPLVESIVESGTLTLRIRPNISIRTGSTITVNVDYKTLGSLSLSDGVYAEIDALKSATFNAAVRDGSKLQLAEANVSDFELSVKDGSSAAVGKVMSTVSQRYKISDGARLTVDNAIGQRVSLTVKDGASANLRALDTKALELSVTDGARADITGVAQQQSYALADAAKVNAIKLQGSTASVRASDGSSLKLGLVQTLDADVQDGSSVSYSGDPVITKRLRDGATLKRL